MLRVFVCDFKQCLGLDTFERVFLTAFGRISGLSIIVLRNELSGDPDNMMIVFDQTF